MTRERCSNLRNRLKHLVQFFLLSFLFAYNRRDRFDFAPTFVDFLQQLLRFFLDLMHVGSISPRGFASRTPNPWWIWRFRLFRFDKWTLLWMIQRRLCRRNRWFVWDRRRCPRWAFASVQRTFGWIRLVGSILQCFVWARTIKKEERVKQSWFVCSIDCNFEYAKKRPGYIELIRFGWPLIPLHERDGEEVYFIAGFQVRGKRNY